MQSFPHFFQALRRVLDFFIPPDWPEGVDRNSARNVVASLIAYGLLAPPYIWLHLTQGSVPVGIVVIISLVVSGASALAIKLYGSLRLCQFIAVCNNYSTFFVGIWYVGGRLDIPNAVWFAVFPLIANFVYGVKGGLISTLVAVATVLGFAAGGAFGWITFPAYPMQHPYFFDVFTVITIIIAAGVLGTLFQFAKSVSDSALIQARRHATELAQAKSEFLANMSHEIRTPMNAIMGMSHLLARTDLTPRQSDYLRKVQLSSKHLLGIINDILDFSKAESGKLAIESIAFEIDSVIQNLGTVLTEKAGEKNLELVFRVAPGVPRYLLGDPLRLGQVLINYANNAIKFTERGEVVIGVNVQEFPDPGQGTPQVVLQFEVRDSGIGLSPEQIGRLFQQFSQADSSTTRKYGGTGLGLAISKTLAGLMGGEVGVRSEVGRGSTFWFTARLGVGEAPPTALTPKRDLRDKRVLVVDDHDLARDVMVELLKSMHFEVRAVASGALAVQAVQEAAVARQDFDVVLMDWQMPHMDGLEAATRIRDLHLERPPHQIMVTPFAREEMMRAADLAGMQDLLLKPVNASTLFDMLISVLGGAEDDRHARKFSGHAALAGSAELEARLQARAGARILLVDDNELNQEVGSELLTDAGFTVDIAVNGAVAVERVDATTYSLVLMDMQMPVMDGVTAALLIRKNPRHATLPIVAMTANAMQADRERCEAAGMNGFVTKPIDPDELWNALVRWIPPRPVAEQVHAPTEPAAPVAPVAPAAPAAPVAPASPAAPVAPAAPAAPVAPAAPAAPVAPAVAHHITAHLPASIDDLDMAQGLRRTGGKPAFYAQMLRRFSATQSEAGTAIAQAVQSGDMDTAERLAHTLKGLAGNFGAIALHDAADALETALRERRPVEMITPVLQRTQTSLMTLVKVLRSALPEPAMPHAEAPEFRASAGVNTAVSTLLDQLQHHLDEDSPEAFDFFVEHRAELHAEFGPAVVALGDALAAFDLEAAKTELATLRSTAT